jgi:hypothetical protein
MKNEHKIIWLKYDQLGRVNRRLPLRDGWVDRPKNNDSKKMLAACARKPQR